MAATATQRPSSPPPGEPAESAFPPLESGDRLTRPEFERRFDAMPELKKAELLVGVVFLGSPVGFRRHSVPHYDAINWLGHYSAFTPGTLGGDNGSIRLDLDNMPQPDAFLLILPEAGGQIRVGDDDLIVGAPELVVEIAASSVSHDLNQKLDVYRRHGVREYLAWRIKDRAIDWFILRDGLYERLEPGKDGILRSEIFPGLSLDPEALIQGDLPTVFAVVQRGLATPEHLAFVERLRLAPPAP